MNIKKEYYIAIRLCYSRNASLVGRTFKTANAVVPSVSVGSMMRALPPDSVCASLAQVVWGQIPGSRGSSLRAWMGFCLCLDCEAHAYFCLSQNEQNLSFGSKQMGFFTVNFPEKLEMVFQSSCLPATAVVGLMLVMESSVRWLWSQEGTHTTVALKSPWELIHNV